MAFLKRHKDEEASFTFKGSTGYRIKKYRELRNMSQKELGIKCGFPEKSADLRIRQYETNKQMPRDKEFLKVIADALGLNEKAIFDLDLSSVEQMYSLLYELEDLYGLRVSFKEGFYYLVFDYGEGESWRRYIEEIYPFLKDWYEMRKRSLPSDTDSEEEIKEKKRAYMIEKGEYPKQVNKKKIDNELVIARMLQLQTELDCLNILKEDSVHLYEEAKEKILNTSPDVTINCPSIKRLSEFMKSVMDIIEQGLPIKGRFVDGHAASVCPSMDESFDLLSVRIMDIDSTQNVAGYAKLTYIVNNLKNLGISIEERLTSLNNELYITYSYPFSESGRFMNMNDSWKEMMRIMEDGSLNGYDYHYRQLRDQFIEDFIKEKEIVFAE